VLTTLLEETANCNRAELHRQIAILDDAGLAWHDEPFSSETRRVVAGRSTPGVGWQLLADIKQASAGDYAYVRRVLADLDFAALDRPPQAAPRS
jgi:hypothetical protein